MNAKTTKKERIVLQRNFSEGKVKHYYSKVSWVYNFWSWLTESKAAKKVLELAEIRDGEQILEIAVGTGSVFAEIVKRNKGGWNLGIDISPSMLSRAEKRLRNFDRKCFHLQIGDAYQLPFQENKFDLIINNFMFDLLPESDFVPILSEFNRVLKSSGRVVISTMAFGGKWYNKIWHWIAKQFPSLLTGCRPVSLYDDLARAGFSNIRVEKLSQNTFPSEVLRAERRPDSLRETYAED
ncbi:MAG: class I SAM-dependent methyltransferase [Bacteroidota bacterium]